MCILCLQVLKESEEEEETASMLLTDLPREMIVVIRNHFLNDEKERNDDGGAFVEDEDNPGKFNANNAHDPKLAQGLPIAWKLVCTSFQDVLRCNVESPLIGLCLSTSMLQWTRRTWNPASDPAKDVRMVQRIRDCDNEGLTEIALGLVPAWHSPEVLSQNAVTYGYTDVLEWMHNRALMPIAFGHLARHAVDYMQAGPLKWLVATGKKDARLTEYELCQLMYYAIEHGNWDMVQQVHDGTGGFEREEEFEDDGDGDNAYQQLDNSQFDYCDTDDENDALWEEGAPIGQFHESGAMSARRNQHSLAAAQHLVNQGSGAWSAADYGTRNTRSTWFMETYFEACPVAAEHGKGSILRRLAELGYKVDKQVMIMALVKGHLDVAKWADQRPEARCTVGDMLKHFHWSVEETRKRDFHLEYNKGMSAYKHQLCHTRERARRDKAEHERQQRAAAKAAQDSARHARMEERLMLKRQLQRASENKRKRDAAIEEDRAEAMRDALRFVANNPLCDRCGNTLNSKACCRGGY